MATTSAGSHRTKACISTLLFNTQNTISGIIPGMLNSESDNQNSSESALLNTAEWQSGVKQQNQFLPAKDPLIAKKQKLIRLLQKRLRHSAVFNRADSLEF